MKTTRYNIAEKVCLAVLAMVGVPFAVVMCACLIVALRGH